MLSTTAVMHVHVDTDLLLEGGYLHDELQQSVFLVAACPGQPSLLRLQLMQSGVETEQISL